jgi:hypothetical protein
MGEIRQDRFNVAVCLGAAVPYAHPLPAGKHAARLCGRHHAPLQKKNRHSGGSFQMTSKFFGSDLPI